MELKLGYKQTEERVIPKGWRACDISDLCHFQRGFDITEATRTSGDVPVYSSSGLSYFHNLAKLPPPSVVTGRKGILGKVFYIEEPCWPHDTTLWVKDFKGNEPKFVYWFLTHFRLERFDAATSVPTLNRNNLVGIPIILPPLPEQRTIAEALSDVDALIGVLDQLIAKKRDLKQGAMQQLLTGKTRLPGFEKQKGYKQTEVGVIPKDWKVLPLQNICNFYNGRAYKLTEWERSGAPVIRLQNLTGGDDYYYSTLRLPSHQYCDYGDLLYMWSATFGPHIWRGEKAIYHYHIWKVGLQDGVGDKSFLYFKLDEITQDKKTRASNGGTMLHLTKESMEKTLISLPSFEEQRVIATVLSDMDAEITALEQRRDKTRALKQGMMQELLTGKTRLI